VCENKFPKRDALLTGKEKDF